MAKKQLCTCSTPFLYISLPSFCPTTTWNFRKLPAYTFYGGNVVVSHFHRGDRSNCHFLTAATKFHVVPTTEKGLLCFFSLALALFLVHLRWVSLYFLFFSLSLYSKFVDMTINLSLILKTARIQKNFPLSVFVFIDSVVVSASQDEGGRTLSRQNKLTFTFGLHELVCTDGRAYTTS